LVLPYVSFDLVVFKFKSEQRFLQKHRSTTKLYKTEETRERYMLRVYNYK